jgi:hypothetical protein
MKFPLPQVHLTTDFKFVLDTISWGALLGSMIDVLPHAATALTVIWMSMRIGETAYGWFKGKKPDTKD